MEIGEYVRTPYHTIEKIERISKENGWTCVTTNKNAYDLKWLKSNKVKHSKDIKDLIKEKDILRYRINNLSAIKIGEVRKCKDARTFKEYLGVEGFSLEQIEILSIVTKERFKESEYVVE